MSDVLMGGGRESGREFLLLGVRTPTSQYAGKKKLVGWKTQRGIFSFWPMRSRSELMPLADLILATVDLYRRASP